MAKKKKKKKKTGKTQAETKFKSGKDWNGNKNGRPKGSKNKFSVAELQKAFEKAAKKNKGKTILEHLAEEAYSDSTLAVALMKKMLPDMRTIEMIGALVTEMSSEEAKRIQEQLRKRFAGHNV